MSANNSSTQTSSFLSIIVELANNKKNKPYGIWADTYIPFYKKLNEAGHTDAFCAYIMLTSTDKSVETWMTDNKSKLDNMNKWYENLPH